VFCEGITLNKSTRRFLVRAHWAQESKARWERGV